MRGKWNSDLSQNPGLGVLSQEHWIGSLGAGLLAALWGLEALRIQVGGTRGALNILGKRMVPPQPQSALPTPQDGGDDIVDLTELFKVAIKEPPLG